MSRELIQKEYDELYALYDKATSNAEREALREAVQLKANQDGSSITDAEFQPYPAHTDSLFQDILFQKKEFHSNQLFLDTTSIEEPCNAGFSIKAHQNFLKNFMTKESPYHSLLVYHGVGVGKTCTGLTIAENFRDIYARKNRRILILCSNNIQIGWKQTIYNPSRDENQCTGSAFVNSEATTTHEVNQLIRQYYEIMAYRSFSNFVKRMIQQYILPLPPEDKEAGKIRCIQEYFSDRLMIIDEVHNIRDEQGGDMRETVKTIEKVIRYSDNLRLVLLTATPMYNRASEIIWILNMMLLNDKRTLIQPQDVFDETGSLTEEGRETIQTKCKGYVSYLRGENPITFPLRLYPSRLKDRNKQRLIPDYTKQESLSIVTPRHCPRLNLVGGRVQGKFQFLEMLGSKLRGLQETVYNQAVENLIRNTPELDLDVRGELNPILDNILLTQLTNMVYPSKSDPKVSLEGFYGARGLKDTMTRRGSRYSYKKHTLQKHGPIFDMSQLPKYSAKIASIIDSIEHSEGIVFVYTSFVDSGIVPLKLALEHHGYKAYGGETYLNFPNFSASADPVECKREPLSFDGLRKSQVEGSFQQGKFMVIDGSTSKNTLQEQLAVVTSKDNQQGQKIKIILGTVVASEGLDFKRIRSIHIMDPWVHLNRIEQTVGRGIRFCSHADLPEEQRNVMIYLHVGTLESDRETIDTSIYRYAEKKSIQIGSVETLLKRGAIDRFFYPDVNVIRKGVISKIRARPPVYQSLELSVDPSDKKYSKVCSYSSDCDYNQDLPSLEIDQLNADTYLDEYSINNIQSIKQKISLLYKEQFVYDLPSMIGLLHEYGFHYEDMVYEALSQMLLEKYTLYDKFGNSGYLIQAYMYYVFQPFLYEDPSMPLYYRMNLLHREARSLTLNRVNQKVTQGSFTPTYSEEFIVDVYSAIDSFMELYETTTVYPDALSILKLVGEVYPVVTTTVASYFWDRLSFSQKCALVYADLTSLKLQSDSVKYIHRILQSVLIYKSTEESNYYFNEEPRPETTELFGFCLAYNHKPQFIEWNQGKLTSCNLVQLNDLKRSLKRYKKTPHYKNFVKSSASWGYTTERTKGVVKECVLKYVFRGGKGSYPPGPGNVCIENNQASRMERLQEAIETTFPLMKDLIQDPLLQTKKNLCFAFELLLRQSSESVFYDYDRMWLKYY